MINSVELSVLESLRRMLLGDAKYSALYDLDISELEEFSSHAECPVAQILKAGEADRFGIVLSAPTLGQVGGWRFATRFKTNFGVVQGPEIEVWLPRPGVLRSFSEVTQFMASQAEAQIKAGNLVIADSEPGKSAGFKTFLVMGLIILTYYGQRPLLTVSGTISYSEFLARRRDEN